MLEEFILVEWIGRKNLYAIEKLPKKNIVRYIIYLTLFFAIYFFSVSGVEEFIYFQF